MAEFRTVCRVGDLAEGQSKVVELGGKLIALFCQEGAYYAIDDVCPHMGTALSDGTVEEGIVTCPWHGWRFRICDGIWADNPRGKVGVASYPVEVVGEEIRVKVGG